MLTLTNKFSCKTGWHYKYCRYGNIKLPSATYMSCSWSSRFFPLKANSARLTWWLGINRIIKHQRLASVRWYFRGNETRQRNEEIFQPSWTLPKIKLELEWRHFWGKQDDATLLWLIFSHHIHHQAWWLNQIHSELSKHKVQINKM